MDEALKDAIQEYAFAMERGNDSDIKRANGEMEEAVAHLIAKERERCALLVEQLDCAHRCGIGSEVARKIREVA